MGLKMSEAIDKDQKKFKLDEEFYCKSRRRRVLVEKCLSDFMNSNAFNKRHSACYRCHVGKRNREEYSSSR